MTNNEYEKACVESATGESEIAWIDTHIEHHLRQVDNLMERRREHAACVVDDIRETAWLGDEIVG